MLFSLLLVACEEEPPPPTVHKLVDLYRPVLRLNTGSMPGGPEQVNVFVHPLLPGVCHPLDLQASLDGRPMERLHGKVEGKNGYDRDCAVYEFTIDTTDIARGPTSHVVVTDGETTYDLVVANLFEPRVATPDRTEVVAGEKITLAWSPATDVAAEKGAIGFELTGGSRYAAIARKDIEIAPGSLSFVVPADVVGDVSVKMFGTDTLQPAVTTCTGAFTCEVSRSYSVADVTLQVSAPN